MDEFCCPECGNKDVFYDMFYRYWSCPRCLHAWEDPDEDCFETDDDWEPYVYPDDVM